MTLYELAKLLTDCPETELVRRERPYKLPKGYLRWEVLSAIVGGNVAALSNRDTRVQLSRDQASMLNAYRTVLWFVQDAPLYCISKEMLREFQETDILEQNYLLADLSIAMPTFLLVLPDNAIQAPSGANVPYCLVHVSDQSHPEWSEGSAYGIKIPYLKHEHSINLHWSTVDADECVWFSGMGLQPDGTCLWSEQQVGELSITEAEQAFLRQMRSIVMQCLLTMTYMPELLESPTDNQESKAHQKRHQAQQKNRVRQPRWIGRTYQRSGSPSSKGGTHATPKRGHWRRSHWRRVAVGVGRTGRKWHKFPCTFVNPDAGSQGLQ